MPTTDTPQVPQDIQLVVGLGNPGSAYAHTRHNAGFQTVDEFARAQDLSYWKNQAGALVAAINYNERKLILAKPQSFMNTSGGPVSKLAQLYDLTPEQILIVHDELNIPTGDIRIKFAGGHGGHNGLRSIINKLNSKNFARIRVGIGRPPGTMDPADYVLRELRGSAAQEFAETIERASGVVADCLKQGVLAAQQTYNSSGIRKHTCKYKGC